eukprot:CAMPEP_0182498002 /NCGR_PEP_ID=MMETSP1321-20130603/6347_1 /TAXON_ID=91990 /ORGANISM="Bolidomonas sp., Strain RCC1657" /LENGTH=216 /DNA_ID=CAMNT_0024702003 /DNA_START=824 /DNA_END=1474 /DNA_ORIENTATION=-
MHAKLDLISENVKETLTEIKSKLPTKRKKTTPPEQEDDDVTVQCPNCNSLLKAKNKNINKKVNIHLYKSTDNGLLWTICGEALRSRDKDSITEKEGGDRLLKLLNKAKEVQAEEELRFDLNNFVGGQTFAGMSRKVIMERGDVAEASRKVLIIAKLMQQYILFQKHMAGLSDPDPNQTPLDPNQTPLDHIDSLLTALQVENGAEYANFFLPSDEES